MVSEGLKYAKVLLDKISLRVCSLILSHPNHVSSHSPINAWRSWPSKVHISWFMISWFHDLCSPAFRTFPSVPWSHILPCRVHPLHARLHPWFSDPSSTPGIIYSSHLTTNTFCHVGGNKNTQKPCSTWRKYKLHMGDIGGPNFHRTCTSPYLIYDNKLSLTWNQSIWCCIKAMLTIALPMSSEFQLLAIFSLSYQEFKFSEGQENSTQNNASNENQLVRTAWLDEHNNFPTTWWEEQCNSHQPLS